MSAQVSAYHSTPQSISIPRTTLTVTSPTNFTPSRQFDQAALALDMQVETYWFNCTPDEQANKLRARLQEAAKLLVNATSLPLEQARDALAHGLRFASWKALTAHLALADGFTPGQLPVGWLDALSPCLVFMIYPEPHVPLPETQLQAFEHLAATLSMLTDLPGQDVLEGVCAPLCADRSWHTVKNRNPLQANAPLYRFEVLQEDAEGGVGGRFESSAACFALTQELDEQRQGYDRMSKAEQRQARRWVEDVLQAQPGFLEGGLALAWMQREAGEEGALTTAKRYVKQAEALIPKGFKGRILWGHLGNRFYHRLLWLVLELHHEQERCDTSVTIARKLLRLNPGDNLGVRYVLPLLLLEQGDVSAAQRTLKVLADEEGLAASAIRAFVAFADKDTGTFRLELATALFTLPVLRAFLLNDNRALPEGETGYRQIQPDVETFAKFAWPSYCTVPGLSKACTAFLKEPVVLKAEEDLRRYWEGYWNARRQGRQAEGTEEGWQALLQQCIERVTVG